MKPFREPEADTTTTTDEDDKKQQKQRWELKMKVPNDFDLEKSVCSHGLFMMSPNKWDPLSRTLSRPLRLPPDSSSTVHVTLSLPPPPSEHHLLVSVDAVHARPLSDLDRHSILAQVSRMLRISDYEDRAMRGFHEVHGAARERGFGRVFRSPTLFEDMVKCILLCNCQFLRTLSMSRALCELQLELSGNFLQCSTAKDFHPRTPPQRELKRKKIKSGKVVKKLASKFVENKSDSVIDINSDGHADGVPEQQQKKKPKTNVASSKEDMYSMCEDPVMGDFPTPQELATLNVKFLQKHCGLGYRAKRIVELAQSIVDGRLRLDELQGICNEAPSDYDKLTKQLMEIKGIGAFTCANILMCMGFYQKIPADTETVRHLKQVHKKQCTILTVKKDVEEIYGQYAPFQFLAYWMEIWDDYEKRFGKLSEMHPSNYRLITASNMRSRIL
ncbi:hypothetical protein QJS10_CPB04g00334 [Acorus calamus]|uniref:HhH-GPD domain-containing protein n=1 Tax=Acorus calamus TaxID=4465 RepID=A0AAV9EZK6_ACOCL|nr:hypothetical protein QJS10_CPB04g00334 [Acorus calamus]